MTTDATATTITRSGLTETAMLVKLVVHSWETEVQDKKVSIAVAQQNEAKVDAGRYMKRLLSKEAVHEVNTLATQARQMHYYLTLPWEEYGYRLLPIAVYDQYKESMDALIEKRIDARNKLVRDYTKHVRQARKDLGKMYRKEQYPSAEDVQDRFSMSYRFFPVPDASHLRDALQVGDYETIRRDVEAQIEDRTREAVTALYARLGEVVGMMSERLELVPGADGEGMRRKAFRDNLVDKVNQVLDILPALNVTGESHLEEMVLTAKASLADVRVNELRVGHDEFSPAKYEKVKSTMDDITEQLKGYFGGE